MNKTLIVVSTPRSGSSWMSRILRMHPDLHVYTHNTNGTQMLYLLYPIRMFNPFGDDCIRDGAISEKVFKGIRVKIARKYYRSSSSDRCLVLASPTNAEFLPLLMDVFPDARYVHLRRNPLDVIASFRKFLEYNGRSSLSRKYKKLRHRGINLASRTALAHKFHMMRWSRLDHPGYIGTRPRGFQKAVDLPPMEFLSWYYINLEDHIERELARIPPHRKHEITYEGLVLNHEVELRRLMEFMGVSVLEEHLRKTSADIKPGGVGRHKKLLSPDELEVVRAYLISHGVDCVETNASSVI